MSEERKKRLAFVTELGIGHLGVPICIAKSMQRLYPDKYEFYFLVNEKLKQNAEKRIQNVKYAIYKTKFDEVIKKSEELFLEEFDKFARTWEERDIVKFNLIGGHPYWKFWEKNFEKYEQVTKLIKEIKPDLIFDDGLMTSPNTTSHGIKHVVLLSSNPTLFGDKNLPPPRSGLPGDLTEENKKLWDNFIAKAIRHEDYLKFMDQANNWLKETNSSVNLDGRIVAYAPSPYLNIYNFPKELDYSQMEGKWVRIDSTIIDIPPPAPIPKKLKDLKGELIYFSLGSASSCYRPLMRRMLKILSEIPARFIISTGPVGHIYTLYDNQYGEKYVDQLGILQTVSVFITHGGNNSVTESIHLSVPMIVLPLYGDQYGNAARIDEKGVGKHLDPFLSTKEDFEKAIEFCLRKDVNEKLAKISNRIKSDNNVKAACEAIVNLLEQK